jgi:hypothetical protein
VLRAAIIRRHRRAAWSGIAVSFVALALFAAPGAAALDRHAFGFNRYDLHVLVDPPRHAIFVEGTVELENRSAQPQREAALQLSSSLEWLSVGVESGPLEWLSQPYTSDIDHTGALSEAIVKFDTPLAPGQSIRLKVRYQGTVEKDATRLERIGTPGELALRSDWDEISQGFTALRGAGYVVWYPVSMEAASLSQGDELFDTLRDWHQRQSASVLHLHLERLQPPESPSESNDIPATKPSTSYAFVANGSGATAGPVLDQEFRGEDPVLVLLEEAAQTTDRPRVEAYYLTAHLSAARDLMASAETIIPPLESWFGSPRRKVVLVELADPGALPYAAGSFFFLPMRRIPTADAELALTPSVVRSMVDSPRPWIREGLASFAQALIRERQDGRRAAIEYLANFRSALATAERQSHAAPDAAPGAADSSGPEPPAIGPQPLLTTADELFFRTKAAYVWWMLRDQLGDRALQDALASYRPEDDRDSAYMQHLLEQQFSPRRELESFFDEWVYRDRGLPQLRIVSANARKTLNNQTVTAVTIENLGEVGCEVPVFVRSSVAEAEQRLYVPAKGKAIVRVPLDGMPGEASVNDGSVPESSTASHRLQIDSAPGEAR